MKTTLYRPPTQPATWKGAALAADEANEVIIKPNPGIIFGAPIRVRYQKGPFVVASIAGHTYWSSTLEPNKYAPAEWLLLKQAEDGFSLIGTCEPAKEWRLALKNFTQLATRLSEEAHVDFDSLKDWHGELEVQYADETKTVQEPAAPAVPVEPERITRVFGVQFAVHMHVQCTGREDEEGMAQMVAAMAKKKVWRGEVDAYIIPEQAMDGTFRMYQVNPTTGDVLLKDGTDQGFVAISNGGGDGVLPHYYNDAFAEVECDLMELRWEELRDKVRRRNHDNTDDFVPLTWEDIWTLDYQIYPLIKELSVPIPWNHLAKNTYDTLRYLDLKDAESNCRKQSQQLHFRYAEQARQMANDGIPMHDDAVTETDLQHANDVWLKAKAELDAFEEEHPHVR